jgi:hypothetical protein
MAIISIPSSIGGISIPGLTTQGPLGLLFNNPFSQTNLQYPRDLQSTTRGHYVTFLIKDINPVGYDETSGYDISGVESAVGQGLSTLAQVTTGLGLRNSELQLSPQTTTSRGSISLYIPETMNFTYGASYNQASLTSIAGQGISSILGGIGGAVSQFVPESKSNTGKALSSFAGGVAGAVSAEAVNVALKSVGLAINPKLQLLFESIGFRSYSMSFTFTPYSQQESEAVTKIINTFKQYAAPRVVKGATNGMFFIPPAIFEPKFYFNGSENKKINAVKPSVIENIDVNYAPNGWSTFGDGAPVQTTLTLQFKETELLDRDTLVTGNY